MKRRKRKQIIPAGLDAHPFGAMRAPDGPIESDDRSVLSPTMRAVPVLQSVFHGVSFFSGLAALSACVSPTRDACRPSRSRTAAPSKQPRSGSIHTSDRSTHRARTSWGRSLSADPRRALDLLGESRRASVGENRNDYRITFCGDALGRLVGLRRLQRGDRLARARIVLEDDPGPVTLRWRAIGDRRGGGTVVVLARNDERGTHEQSVSAGVRGADTLRVERIFRPGHLELVHVDGRVGEEQPATFGHRRAFEGRLEDGDADADLVPRSRGARHSEKHGHGDRLPAHSAIFSRRYKFEMKTGRVARRRSLPPFSFRSDSGETVKTRFRRTTRPAERYLATRMPPRACAGRVDRGKGRI